MRVVTGGTLIDSCGGNHTRGMVLNKTKHEAEWMGWVEDKRRIIFFSFKNGKMFWFFLFNKKYLRISNKSNKKLKINYLKYENKLLL